MVTAAPDATLVLITGANQGIGFATAEVLASEPHNYHVLLGSRNSENGALAAAALQQKGLSVEPITIDVQDDGSITAAAATVASKYGHLDVLINNAGVVMDKAPVNSPIIRSDFHRTMDINVFGAAMTTEAFIPLLEKSTLPRVVFVTSSLGSMGVLKEGKNPSSARHFTMYRCSKAAMNMLSLVYATKYKDWKVNTCDPGIVRTYFSGTLPPPAPHLAEPIIGATNSVRLATLGSDGESGTFSSRNGPLPW